MRRLARARNPGFREFRLTPHPARGDSPVHREFGDCFVLDRLFRRRPSGRINSSSGDPPAPERSPAALARPADAGPSTAFSPPSDHAQSTWRSRPPDTRSTARPHARTAGAPPRRTRRGRRSCCAVPVERSTTTSRAMHRCARRATRGGDPPGIADAERSRRNTRIRAANPRGLQQAAATTVPNAADRRKDARSLRSSLGGCSIPIRADRHTAGLDRDSDGCSGSCGRRAADRAALSGAAEEAPNGIRHSRIHAKARRGRGTTKVPARRCAARWIDRREQMHVIGHQHAREHIEPGAEVLPEIEACGARSKRTCALRRARNQMQQLDFRSVIGRHCSGMRDFARIVHRNTRSRTPSGGLRRLDVTWTATLRAARLPRTSVHSPAR